MPMQSNNPAFNPKTLEKLRASGVIGADRAMTVEGSINKIGILTTLCIASSAFSWSIAHEPYAAGLAGLSIIINLILGFVIIFKKQLAPALSPAYAIIEGLALGFISYYAEAARPGVVMNAFIATFGILFGMVFIYRFKIIQVTQRFKMGMSIAMIGIFAAYIFDFVAGLFGHPLPMIHQAGPSAMIFSLIAISVASLCFLLDFDMIDKASAAGAPKWMEWYAGFSVLLTLVWLYLEILRLLGRRR